jgi:hypothetical protein
LKHSPGRRDVLNAVPASARMSTAH